MTTPTQSVEDGIPTQSVGTSEIRERESVQEMKIL